MEWLGKVVDVLRSPRLLVAAMLASATLLFFPADWLPGTPLAELRAKHGVLLLIAMVVSATVLLVDVCRWAAHRRRVGRTKKERQAALVQRLSNLDEQEQIILREFQLQARNTIKLPVDHSVVAGLRSAGILILIQNLLERCSAGRVGSFVVSEHATKCLTEDMIGLPMGELSEEDEHRILRARPVFVHEILEYERVWQS